MTKILWSSLIMKFAVVLSLFLNIVSVNAFQTAPVRWTTLKSAHPQSRLTSNFVVTPTVLLMSSSGNNDTDKEYSNSNSDPNDDKMAKKVEGRKKRVTIGNRIVSIGFFASFLSSLYAILKTTNNNIIQTLSIIDPFPLVASAFSYILVGASQNDRLSSDTYKRLNLNLILYGMLCFSQSSSPFHKLLCTVTCINSIKGFAYGTWGWELKGRSVKSFLTECKDGFVGNVKTLVKITNIKSAIYLLATLFTGVPCVMGLWRGQYSNAAALLLLTTTTFSLKDAADRNRLQGTTFIELNGIASLVFAQTSAALSTSAFKSQAIAASLFSVFSAVVGASSLLEKRQKQESS